MKATKLPSGNYRVRIFVKTASGKQIKKSFTGPGKKEVEREAQRYLLDLLEDPDCHQLYHVLRGRRGGGTSRHHPVHAPAEVLCGRRHRRRPR